MRHSDVPAAELPEREPVAGPGMMRGTKASPRILRMGRQMQKRRNAEPASPGLPARPKEPPALRFIERVAPPKSVTIEDVVRQRTHANGNPLTAEEDEAPVSSIGDAALLPPPMALLAKEPEHDREPAPESPRARAKVVRLDAEQLIPTGEPGGSAAIFRGSHIHRGNSGPLAHGQGEGEAEASDSPSPTAVVLRRRHSQQQQQQQQRRQQQQPEPLVVAPVTGTGRGEASPSSSPRRVKLPVINDAAGGDDEYSPVEAGAQPVQLLSDSLTLPQLAGDKAKLTPQSSVSSVTSVSSARSSKSDKSSGGASSGRGSVADPRRQSNVVRSHSHSAAMSSYLQGQRAAIGSNEGAEDEERSLFADYTEMKRAKTEVMFEKRILEEKFSTLELQFKAQKRKNAEMAAELRQLQAKVMTLEAEKQNLLAIGNKASAPMIKNQFRKQFQAIQQMAEREIALQAQLDEATRAATFHAAALEKLESHLIAGSDDAAGDGYVAVLLKELRSRVLVEVVRESHAAVKGDAAAADEESATVGKPTAAAVAKLAQKHEGQQRRDSIVSMGIASDILMASQIEDPVMLRAMTNKALEMKTVNVDEVKSIGVPAEMQANALRFEKVLSTFAEGISLDPRQGEVALGGRSYVLMRASSLSSAFLEAIVSQAQDRGDTRETAVMVGRQLLYDFGVALGRSDFSQIRFAQPEDSQRSLLIFAMMHLAHCGWGRLELDASSNLVPGEDFCLRWSSTSSFEANSWMQQPEAEPHGSVCQLLCGFLAGFCEQCFDVTDLQGCEMTCRALGSHACQFALAPAAKIGALISGTKGVVHMQQNKNFHINKFLEGRKLERQLKISKKENEEILERLREEHEKLLEEQARSESLLYSMIPPHIAAGLKSGKTTITQKHELVTILFTDIVGFTSMSFERPVEHIVQMLNDMYTVFDKLTEVRGVFKVETIGDAYMVVGGIPDPLYDQVERVLLLALDMMQAVHKIRFPDGSGVQIRIGVHCGPVMSGVIGLKQPRFSLFGDTVNTTARLESTSLASRIQVSDAIHSRAKKLFAFESRGSVQLKNRGKMETYFLKSRIRRIGK